MSRYHIVHETEYSYSQPVLLSQQMLHMQPRPLARQMIHDYALTISPTPDHQLIDLDAWGNPCQRIELNQPHETLRIVSQLDVSVLPEPALDLAASAPWRDLAAQCRFHGSQRYLNSTLAALEFRQQSPMVPIKQAFVDWSADCFADNAPVLICAQRLMEKIHHELTFDPEATQVGTPLLEVLAKGRGVCQDFAQLMIACLRSHGLSASYVSGYLLTHPPEGQARLIGADASHAWVSVWCPELGWVDFDPTNNLRPAQEHITLTWGRDFTDVSPMRGVIYGGGQHDVRVAVTVMPVTETG